ncbi:DUF1569 domain-containing protein [Flavobacterium sp. RSB2_4_14]|uniref:DUF1569 domain-containing protein n=1 Tax=Flavobacterium sp. RSB2_4_14 TaxID=3447665 RepID=UPI003F3ADEC9
MNELHQLIDQLEKNVVIHQKINLEVSQASVSWHIDHSLLVINGIITQLKVANPKEYQWSFNWKRTYIQVLNKFPRGKGKAPKVVQPSESATIESLISKIEVAKQNVADMEKLDPNAYFSHPYFGNLNLKATFWFLKLHTKHHLKIIKDINSEA